MTALPDGSIDTVDHTFGSEPQVTAKGKNQSLDQSLAGALGVAFLLRICPVTKQHHRQWRPGLAYLERLADRRDRERQASDLRDEGVAALNEIEAERENMPEGADKSALC